MRQNSESSIQVASHFTVSATSLHVVPSSCGVCFKQTNTSIQEECVELLVGLGRSGILRTDLPSLMSCNIEMEAAYQIYSFNQLPCTERRPVNPRTDRIALHVWQGRQS